MKRNQILKSFFVNFQFASEKVNYSNFENCGGNDDEFWDCDNQVG